MWQSLRLLLALPLILSLAACQDAPKKRTAKRGTDWDHYDYQRIAREKAPVDNDAFYVLPSNTGCLDDAPSNSDSACQ